MKNCFNWQFSFVLQLVDSNLQSYYISQKFCAMQMRYVSQHQFHQMQQNSFIVEAVSYDVESQTLSSNRNMDRAQSLSQKTNGKNFSNVASKTLGSKAKSFSKKHLFSNLSAQVHQLREEKESIQEQINSMLANFSYILELLSENLSGSVCDIFRSRSDKMNKKFQKMVCLLNQQKQQELQAKKYKLITEENWKLKSQLKTFISKYQKLLEETNDLKGMLSKVQVQLRSIKMQQNYSLPYYPKQEQEIRAQCDSLRAELLSPLKLKKLKTFEGNRNRYTSPTTRRQINSNVKSLEKIKEKIQQLKNQINS